MERSIASQIEFWAELGKAIEPLLRFDEVLALKKSGQAKPLSQCIADIDTPIGRQSKFSNRNHFPIMKASRVTPTVTCGSKRTARARLAGLLTGNSLKCET